MLGFEMGQHPFAVVYKSKTAAPLKEHKWHKAEQERRPASNF
jgi:hypothetical protein